MDLGRSWRPLALALIAVTAVAGCNRRKPAEVVDVTPSLSVNRARAPLGSALEVTYTWTAGPGAKKLDQNYRAFVHFMDSHDVILFGDDHVPVPAPSTWEPGKAYSYTRTVFIPIYPYVGDVEARVGLYPEARGERLALKGEDAGMREYRVAKMEVLPQTENIFLVYKEGWHNPESSPQNPSLERTWTKKDALVSFKNPKKDIVVYLEADTNYKAFDFPPVLTVAVNGRSGLVVPIDNSEVFLKKIRVKAADLGNEEWVDLKLSMNQSFVPKLKGVNTHDDRELGLLVYHLYVSEADKLGILAQVVDAGPLVAAPAVASASPSPAATRPAAGTRTQTPAATPARTTAPAPTPTPTPRS